MAIDRKTAPHRRNLQSTTTNGRVQRTSLESVADDGYWRFLEEIDAPMWVDLEAEAQSMEKDSDDAWFRRIHPFHQCSSHHFISSFPLFDQDNPDMPNWLSPKLPGSVSGSRGKHYKKQSWANATGITSRLQKFPAESELFQHPIKLLGSQKSLSSNSDNDHITSTGESTRTLSKISKVSFESMKITLNSYADIVEKSCQRPAVSRVSRSFSTNGGLLSAVRVCLRRSFVTGHASRVEIKDERHLKNHKSLSSKSSIGSTNMGGTSGSGGGLGTSKNERTPQSRMVSTTVRPENGLRKSSKLTSTARAHTSERMPSLKMKTCTTAIPKVLQTTASRKPLQPLYVAAAPKVKTAIKPKQGVSALKTQKRSSTKTLKENATKLFVQSKKGPTCSAYAKDGKGISVVKGKCNGSNQTLQVRNQKAVARTVHLHLR